MQKHLVQLKSIYHDRVQKNPRYSLRAFARDLDMTPQMLSAVLNGKRHLSFDSGVEIAVRVGLGPDDTEDFIDSLLLSTCKSAAARNLVSKRISERSQTDSFKNLNLEAFRLISDWYHLALMELIKTNDFKPNPKWIAARLNITPYQVKEALERLVQLDLIKKTETGYQLTNLNLSALSEVPAAALREHAKQILSKSIEALDTQSQDERDVTSITMAIDPRKLPLAKKMIQQFRRRLSRMLENGSNSEVYVFSSSLIRLTERKPS